MLQHLMPYRTCTRLRLDVTRNNKKRNNKHCTKAANRSTKASNIRRATAFNLQVQLESLRVQACGRPKMSVSWKLLEASMSKLAYAQLASAHEIKHCNTKLFELNNPMINILGDSIKMEIKIEVNGKITRLATNSNPSLRRCNRVLSPVSLKSENLSAKSPTVPFKNLALLCPLKVVHWQSAINSLYKRPRHQSVTSSHRRFFPETLKTNLSSLPLFRLLLLLHLAGNS